MHDEDDGMVVAPDSDRNDKDPPSQPQPSTDAATQFLRFPSLFSSDFGPSALLYSTPTPMTPMNYGEGLNASRSNDFSIMRPTIELPLDELLHHVETSDSTDLAQYRLLYCGDYQDETQVHTQAPHKDIFMPPMPTSPLASLATPTITRKISPVTQESESETSDESDGEDSEYEVHHSASGPSRRRGNHSSQTAKEVLPETVTPSKVNLLFSNRAGTPSMGRPSLTVRTQGPLSTRSSGPGATATGMNSAVLRQPNNSSGGGNSAPGGMKAECTNCGATHIPLGRHGLNDGLNCHACGLCYKLVSPLGLGFLSSLTVMDSQHKRRRPKTMRNTHGESRAQVVPRQETVDAMGASSAVPPPTPKIPQRSSSPIHRTAQCYSCHTTTTPLWRKDDEGKMVCNACVL